MNAFGTRVFMTLIVLVPLYALEDEFELKKCDYLLKSEPSRKLNTSDCDLESKDDQFFINCVIRLSAEAPADPNEFLFPDDTGHGNTTDNRNVTIYLDYKYKFGLYRPDYIEDEGPEVVRCLAVLSLSYDRKMEKGNYKRENFPLASRIFNVVANSEMLSSDVDLMNPVVIGTAIIDASCFKSLRKNSSSCLHDVGINMTPAVPGSNQDVYAGTVEFSIKKFGYSYLSSSRMDSSLNEDLQMITSFPDRTRWGKYLLRYIPGDNITELRLPKNRWSSIEKSDIPILPKLEILDLSSNAFETFESGAFGNTHLLKELNFSESHLQTIPSFIKNQTLLKILNLGGNTFIYDEDTGATALTPIISNLTQIEILNISGFTTRYFANNTLPPLPHLKNLDASNCKILDIEENAFKNHPTLTRIDLSKNVLNTLPPKLFSTLKNLVFIDLSLNKFTRGQGLIFPSHKNWPESGMQVLDMSSNVLESAANLVASGSNVKHINLARNVLKDLDGAEFYSYYTGPWVKELDLSSNLIPALSSSAYNSLHYVDSVNLTDNQFNCDSCDLPGFQNWLNTTGRDKLTASPETLMCAAPPAARKAKKIVLMAEYNAKLCQGPDYSVMLGSTFSGVALIVALATGVLYIYRFEASYVLHLIRVRRKAAKGEGKPHSECIYDAFVSYSGRDRTWVLRVLQPGLEESEHRYQLCLHDRNFTLGGIITQNIVDSIDKSRKTILILSENFVDSQWCRWEMEMANHKLFNDSRDFLVLIELDRLDRKNLPRHLRFLMDTRTYLEWPTAPSTAIVQPVTSSSPDQSISNPSTSVVSTSATTSGNVSEQALTVFWKRLREALGDSLYVKEQKALKEAKLAVLKTKARDSDVMKVSSRSVGHLEEESNAVLSN